MIDVPRLRRLRHHRGLSQRQRAAAIGVDPLTVKRLETGAATGDLPLRVLGRLADTLGVTPAQLLAAPDDEEQQPTPTKLVADIGATLLACGRTTITALADTTNTTPADVTTALSQLAATLRPGGIAIARYGDEVWLAPTTVGAARPATATRPLRADQARLLRRIHRGEDIRRKLNKTGRELVLPALLNQGLIDDRNGQLRLGEDAAISLDPSSWA
jgi:transcriptional regulator with XRE-family HTH domain